MWGIEFYNEAELKSPKPKKSVSGNSLPRKDTIPEEPAEKPQESETGGSETPSSDPNPDPFSDVPKENSPIEEHKSQDVHPQSEEDDSSKESEDVDTSPRTEGEDERENMGRAPKLSQISQDSSNLDEEYVIIENEKQKQKEARPKPGNYLLFFCLCAYLLALLIV